MVIRRKRTRRPRRHPVIRLRPRPVPGPLQANPTQNQHPDGQPILPHLQPAQGLNAVAVEARNAENAAAKAQSQPTAPAPGVPEVTPPDIQAPNIQPPSIVPPNITPPQIPIPQIKPPVIQPPNIQPPGAPAPESPAAGSPAAGSPAAGSPAADKQDLQQPTQDDSATETHGEIQIPVMITATATAAHEQEPDHDIVDESLQQQRVQELSRVPNADVL